MDELKSDSLSFYLNSASNNETTLNFSDVQSNFKQIPKFYVSIVFMTLFINLTLLLDNSVLMFNHCKIYKIKFDKQILKYIVGI